MIENWFPFYPRNAFVEFPVRVEIIYYKILALDRYLSNFRNL